VKLVNALLAFFYIVVIASCASHPSRETAGEPSIDFATDTIGKLQKARNDYEAARETGDGVAMAQAALTRLEVSARSWSRDVEVQLIMKTRDLLRQARIVAGDDEAAQAAIKKLIEGVDLGPSVVTVNGRLVGGVLLGLTSPLFGKQFRTYTLDAGDVEALDFHVTASKGAIVYVEARELSGIVLTIRANDKNSTKKDDQTILCRDASPHGFLICRWRPQRDGVVKIILENPGMVGEPVLMITNQ